MILCTRVDSQTISSLERIFSVSNLKCFLPPVQKQKGMKDCGTFAVAFATFWHMVMIL